jgi:hypothetical protein
VLPGRYNRLRAGFQEMPRMRKMLDRSQDAYMAKCGVKVLRFWETDVFRNAGQVSKSICEAIGFCPDAGLAASKNTGSMPCDNLARARSTIDDLNSIPT